MDKLILLLTIISITLFEALGQVTLCDFQNLYCSRSPDSRLVSIQKELTLRNYNSLKHNYAPSFSFSFSPNYSQSISPITQPDGTVKNHNIHNFSLSPSISANFPLPFSGGAISVSSSIGYYRNINGSNSYTNISANFFSLHISQPLSFFRNSKWGLRTARASYEIGSVEVIRDYLKVRSDATDLYFNFLNMTTSLSNIEKQISAQIDWWAVAGLIAAGVGTFLCPPASLLPVVLDGVAIYCGAMSLANSSSNNSQSNLSY